MPSQDVIPVASFVIVVFDSLQSRLQPTSHAWFEMRTVCQTLYVVYFSGLDSILDFCMLHVVVVFIDCPDLWMYALMTSVYRDREISESACCPLMYVLQKLVALMPDGKRNCCAYFPICDKNLLFIKTWTFPSCGRNQSLFLFQTPMATLQKWKCCFNLDRVISLAASLPKQANQLHCWSL